MNKCTAFGLPGFLLNFMYASERWYAWRIVFTLKAQNYSWTHFVFVCWNILLKKGKKKERKKTICNRNSINLVLIYQNASASHLVILLLGSAFSCSRYSLLTLETDVQPVSNVGDMGTHTDVHSMEPLREISSKQSSASLVCFGPWSGSSLTQFSGSAFC